MPVPCALGQDLSRGRGLPGRRGGRAVVAVTAGVVAALMAAAWSPPAHAARPAKRCSTAGVTLGLVGPRARPDSRVWRSRGVTSGCTILPSGRARTSVLTRVPTGVVRLDRDTVAWTTPRGAGESRTDRVSLFDLRWPSRELRAVPAVPSTGPGVPRRPGRVDALAVSDGGDIAWVADGTTVVVGATADPTAEFTLLGADGAESPLYRDASVAVAASYPADPAVTERLRASLAIGVVPGDPGDADGCLYSFATAFRWDPGAGAAEARMRGLRATYGAGCR
jgi:hypothetical protein